MDQQNGGNNKKEMAEKKNLVGSNETDSLNEEKGSKSSILALQLPAELINELFAALPLENAFDLMAKMPNFILARTVRKMLKSVKMAMKTNKWNLMNCETKLTISKAGLMVRHSGPERKKNCVRAELPIPKFNLNVKLIVYFEVEIVNKIEDWDYAIGIGFCEKQFPLESEWQWLDFDTNTNSMLGFTNNSIGMWFKCGIWIEGYIIGVGIINKSANLQKKCFASLNSELLGMVKLPAKFSSLQLYPAVTLFQRGDTIRTNFGVNEWRFNASKIK